MGPAFYDVWSVCGRFHVLCLCRADQMARSGCGTQAVAARGYRPGDYGNRLVRGRSSQQHGHGSGRWKTGHRLYRLADSVGLYLCGNRHCFCLRQQNDEADSDSDRRGFRLCVGSNHGSGRYQRHHQRSLVCGPSF